MEHEVVVPVPAESVRRVLADPARVARCVPGLQQDADSAGAGKGGLAGRLKVRIDGHTITYRGTVRFVERDGGYEIDGEGTEARGPGSVTLSLKLGLADADAGTTLRWTGTARATDGRLAQIPPEAALTAARRLLDRFGDRVRAEAQADGSGGVSGSGGGAADAAGSADARAADAAGAADAGGTDTGAADAAGSADSGSSTDSDGATPAPTDEPASTDSTDANDSGDGDGHGDAGASVFDTEVPPPSLDPAADAGFTAPGEPPVEAAHARRTMIGRSAEEVDHAPPRGRYAPVPAPSSSTAGATLRWAAPAAALALASAVVVGRALRRRR
ncbi:SRPBCC family protein [Streptomyces sp. NBC_01089]|uniref:SRPBCC family protein n=1 Tax=Streptomyces sp. NBC_01089 TaxID=2903747 RepID=UPI00386A6F39|nr:SRPBCC domain-containing protein [Streptomyces sp. NBC_01089]